MVREATWLVATLVWSVGGLVIGFMVGRLYCEVHELREALMATDAKPLERRHGHDRRGISSGHSRGQTLLGVALVLMAVATVTLAALQASRQASLNDRQQTFNACQQRYNSATLIALAARAAAANTDRSAITGLVQESAGLQTSTLAPEERRARLGVAFRRYLDVVNEADRIRSANPVPKSPTCVS